MSEESDKTQREEEKDMSVSGGAGDETAQGAETAADDDAGTGVKTGAEDERARLEAEAADLKDRLLRTMAELENFRRRAEKEREDTAKYAITGFARDSLTVLDNLRRGLETVTEEDRKAAPALESLAVGMELTEREMLATLERHGIKQVDPAGDPFDPNLHQAMYEVEDPSQPAGTVVQVAQVGYMLHGRLLRPAMVGVSKGGPKRAPVQAPIANEDLANPQGANPQDAGSQDAGPQDMGPSGDASGQGPDGSSSSEEGPGGN